MAIANYCQILFGQDLKNIFLWKVITSNPFFRSNLIINAKYPFLKLDFRMEDIHH
jgi:hypothetical protein